MFREITARLYLHVQMMRTALSRFYAQTTPRGRAVFALLAIILLIALATGEVVLYRFGYFLIVGIAACYVWTWTNLRRLDMWMEEQGLIGQVGEVLTGSICVHNDSAIPTGWVEIGLVSDMPGHVCEGATRLPARGWEQWRTEVLCRSRGVYTIGPLVAQSSDPIGLFRMQTTHTEPVTVVVYPHVVELTEFQLPVADLSGEERAPIHLHTRSAQASSVRDYSSGDSLNRIHWPSTARHGQLMAKDFDSGKSSDVWIILDLDRSIHLIKEEERTDEYAVTVAASIARFALSQQCSVGLIAYGDHEYVLAPSAGTTQMSRVLETLALSKTEGTVSLKKVLVENSPKIGRSASTIVVTSSTETDWVSELQHLRYCGLSIAVVLVEPMSFGGERSCTEAGVKLMSAGIASYMIRSRDDISRTLSRPTTVAELSELEPSDTSLLTPVLKA